MILGLAQGYANMGMLPIPEIQYLAYFHNACDQIRGEAASRCSFSRNDQYRNPMVMRIAGLGYQRGFGGHFHNDNSITALRDIPGLVVGCASRGDDAASMLRTLMALAKVDGRVSVFLEPIALYMTKDLYDARRWRVAVRLSRARSGHGAGRGQRLPPEMGAGRSGDHHLRQRRADEPARRARARKATWLEDARGRPALAGAAQRRPIIAAQAKGAKRILIVDEGRHSAGVGEGVITALSEAGCGATPLSARGRRRHLHAAGRRGVAGAAGRRRHRRGGTGVGVGQPWPARL